MSRQNVMTSTFTPSRQTGFGLVEVLAAVLVLGVGVIGFAALQMRAIHASGDAYARTQAIAIAQDLAERMRVNLTQAAAYRTAANWTSAVPTAAPTTCSTTTADCSTATMVTYDVASVRYNAATLLPQGLMRVEGCQGSTLTCVYVAWDGLQPTAGTGGECVTDAGAYVSPGANRPSLSCVMLEVQ